MIYPNQVLNQIARKGTTLIRHHCGHGQHCQQVRKRFFTCWPFESAPYLYRLVLTRYDLGPQPAREIVKSYFRTFDQVMAWETGHEQRKERFKARKRLEMKDKEGAKR